MSDDGRPKHTLQPGPFGVPPVPEPEALPWPQRLPPAERTSPVLILEPEPDSETARRLLRVAPTLPPVGSDRPTFQDLYMQFAHGLSMRSTCHRLKVGCVIVSTDHTQVYAVGYNGNAHGLQNGCDSDEPGRCGCLHAEENAVIHCRQPRETPKIVFTTHLPCVMCAKRLIQLGGVERVIYDQDYRVRDGLDVLRRAGIRVHQ